MRSSLLSILFIISCFPSLAPAGNSSALKAEVRPPAVAGQFYPDYPDRLSKSIGCFMAGAVTPFSERPLAIIAPHAGYIYSGQIAADAFKQAAAFDYDLIVLLGTNHTSGWFDKISIYPGGGYRTPLGTAAIDEDLARQLIARDKDFTFDKSVHAREHSVEVMVPFVQTLFPGKKILAAVIGRPDPSLCDRFGRALASALGGRRALIVASTDLSHFPVYNDALVTDRSTIEAIMKLDPQALQESVKTELASNKTNLSTCACGLGPVMTAIVAAKQLGATAAQIISYANSGDAAVGQHDRVVGYTAAALVTKPVSETAAVFGHPDAGSTGRGDYSSAQKHRLLSFARQTIHQLLTAETTPLARGFDHELERKSGVFVTLKKHGRLRGCIGHMAEDLPLCQVVGYCALQAAFNDRRFPQVSLDELDDIEIEISVLTPFEPVEGPDHIVIGRDGVVLKKDGASAVYLPSVAVEQGWDVGEMLSHLSQKAGLDRNAWKQDAKFYTFQAKVFSESEQP